jgi:hypothetical protein
MDLAAIAWIVVGVIVVLAILISFISMIPELRRYLRIRHM